MNKEPLICIRDCDPINHLHPSYWIDEGSLIERYQCDEISLFIIKNGRDILSFHLYGSQVHRHFTIVQQSLLSGSRGEKGIVCLIRIMLIYPP